MQLVTLATYKPGLVCSRSPKDPTNAMDHQRIPPMDHQRITKGSNQTKDHQRIRLRDPTMLELGGNSGIDGPELNWRRRRRCHRSRVNRETLPCTRVQCTLPCNRESYPTHRRSTQLSRFTTGTFLVGSFFFGGAALSFLQNVYLCRY